VATRSPSAPPQSPGSTADASRPRPGGLRANALVWTIGNLSYYGVVFVITPIAIDHLGSDGWGIWQLVGATVTYAYLLQLGLGTSLHYQVAVRSAAGDWSQLAKVLSSVRLYLLLVGMLLLVLVALGGRLFVDSLVEPDHRPLAWAALVVSTSLTSLDFQLRLYSSVLAGLQRMELFGIFQMTGALVVLTAVVVGFRAGMELRGFAAVMTLGPSFASLCAWFTCRRMLPAETRRLVRPDAKLFRELLAYSLSTLLYTAGGVVLYQTMKFMASWRCGGIEAAGHMGLAIGLAQTISVVFTPAVGVLQSRVGQFQGEGRLEQVAPLLERALVALGLLLLPSVVFLVVDSRAIFEAWVGGTAAASALGSLTSTARLLFLGHCFYIAALPFYFVLLGVGEHRVFGIGMLAVAVLNTVLGWLATSAFPRIETLGAVYGLLMLGLVLCVTAPAGLRRFRVPIARVLRRGLGVPLLAAAPGALVLAWRPRLGQPLLDLVLDAALFGALCLPGLEVARRRFDLPLGFRLRA